MHSDVQFHAQELDALLADFRACLNGVGKLQPEEKRKCFLEIRQISQRIRTTREAYILELRSLPPENARLLKDQLDQKMEEFKKMSTEFEWKRTEINRDQLFLEAANYNEPTQNADGMGREQLVLQGDEVQDKTLESIHRMKQMVGETENIGKEVVQRLDEQTEQMMRIHEGMNDVEYNLKRAKKTIRSIARNAATDRCVQIACLLIFAAVVAIIIFVATNGKSKK